MGRLEEAQARNARMRDRFRRIKDAEDIALDAEMRSMNTGLLGENNYSRYGSYGTEIVDPAKTMAYTNNIYEDSSSITRAPNVVDPEPTPYDGDPEFNPVRYKVTWDCIVRGSYRGGKHCGDVRCAECDWNADYYLDTLGNKVKHKSTW